MMQQHQQSQQQHLFRHHKSSRPLIAAPPVPNPGPQMGESSSEAVVFAGSSYPIQELKNQHQHHHPQFQQQHNLQNTGSHSQKNIQQSHKRTVDRFQQQPVKGHAMPLSYSGDDMNSVMSANSRKNSAGMASRGDMGQQSSDPKMTSQVTVHSHTMNPLDRERLRQTWQNYVAKHNPAAGAMTSSGGMTSAGPVTSAGVTGAPGVVKTRSSLDLTQMSNASTSNFSQAVTGATGLGGGGLGMNSSFDGNKRFPSYLNSLYTNPTGSVNQLYPTNVSYRSSGSASQSNKYPYSYWSNLQTNTLGATAPTNGNSSRNWSSLKYLTPPNAPPPSANSQVAPNHANQTQSSSIMATVDSMPVTFGSSVNSVRSSFQDSNNNVYMPTQTQLQQIVSSSGAEEHSRSLGLKNHFHKGAGAGGAGGGGGTGDHNYKSAGTSPMPHSAGRHHGAGGTGGAAHAGSTHYYQITNDYQEWMHTQQKELKRILRGEISQIKELIENFGERLDSIQLIIRKSIEVSKTQDLETSTTSSSMTVTKKLKGGGGRKRTGSTSAHEKNSSKLISKELLKTLTTGPPSGMNDGGAPQSAPSGGKYSNHITTKGSKNPSSGRKGLSVEPTNQKCVSQDEELSVEIVKEDESRKTKTQKTASKESNRNLVDVTPVEHQPSFEMGHQQSLSSHREYRMVPDGGKSLVLLRDKLDKHVDSFEGGVGRHRDRDEQETHREIVRYSKTMEAKHDLQSYAAPFQFQHPHVVNTAAKLTTNQSCSGAGAVGAKLERKMNYISPIASRPVSTDSKLPLIPETDEMSIHCASSRESDTNCVAGSQKESVEHDRNDENADSTLTNRPDDLTAGGDASTREGTTNLHPTQGTSAAAAPTAPAGMKAGAATSSSLANELLGISDPHDLLGLGLKGGGGGGGGGGAPCSHSQSQGVAAQGDKLDERISCMRSEISELKQWILMLQKNAESQLEQGDLGEALEDLYRKMDSSNFKDPPPSK